MHGQGGGTREGVAAWKPRIGTPRMSDKLGIWIRRVPEGGGDAPYSGAVNVSGGGGKQLTASLASPHNPINYPSGIS